MSTSSGDATRHHYVSQFYLKGFARNGQLRSVDLSTGSTYTASVRASAMKFGFYAVPKLTADPEIFERLFGRFEGEADLVLRRVINGEWPLPPDARVVLSNYVAFQALRGPEQRQMMLKMQGDLKRREMGRVADVGAAQWIEERLHLSVDEKRAQELWDRAIAEGESEYVVDAFFHIQQIARLARKAQPHLLRRRWKLVRFDEPSLFTSDAPVSLNAATGDTRERLGLATAADVVLPLNRYLALVMNESAPHTRRVERDRLLNGEFDRAVRGGCHARRFVNARTAHSANDALFCHPADINLVTRDHLRR